MKIEAGQWWEDGRGRRVKIVHVAPEIHDYCVIGIIRGDNLFCCEEWTAAGWYSSANQHPRHNLVKHLPECTGWDWEPPKPVDPGEWWRLLEVGETINDGDEFWSGDKWEPLSPDLIAVRYVRRRIKPDVPADWRLIGGVPGGMLYFKPTEAT